MAGLLSSERAARAVFGYANPRSPGLTAVFRLAFGFAAVDEKAREIVIDVRAVFRALIAAGIDLKSAQGEYNSSHWFVRWLMRDNKISFPPQNLRNTDFIKKFFESEFQVVASVSMREEVLPQAIAIAGKTTGRKTYDLRHLLAALVKTKSAKLVAALDVPTRTLSNILPRFNDAFFQNLAEYQRNDNLDAWREILSSPSPADPEPTSSTTASTNGEASKKNETKEVGEPELVRRSAITVPGYSSDRPNTGADDSLGIGPEVMAFARLICLEEALPPLSIGIFGDWGAGKSTFMERLESEVDDITKRERDRRADRASTTNVDGSRFVANVVQIRFNAWHFADANLWASLAAEFFDQLRAGGYKRQGAEVHSRLVEKVNAYVHSLSKGAAATQAALTKSEAELREVQQKRDRAVRDAKDAEGDLLSQAIVEQVAATFGKHKTDVETLKLIEKTNDPAKAVADFVQLAKDIHTLRGKLKTILKAIWNYEWSGVPLLLMLIFAVLTGVFMWFHEGTGWSISAFATFLSLAAAAVRPVNKVIALVNDTAAFADKLGKVQETRLKAVLDGEVAFQAKAEEVDARRRAADQAGRALTRYVGTDGTANPPRLLRYMLEDDPDTKILEAEIGLISRARRLFQAVDVIVKNDKAPDVPERIVLYIDDLDRCNFLQVYNVLQAIHLLLAFRLFVVVVGVDVAWIQDAINSQMPEDWMAASAGNSDIELRRRKRAIAYLGKIFQIPFWLRPLSSDGSGGGSYASFVRAILSETPEAKPGGSIPPGQQPGPQPVGEKTGPSGPEEDGQDGANAGSATVDGKEAAQEESKGQKDGQGPVKPEISLEEALDTIRLTSEEADFLAEPAIGALAAKDPRGVKRLINTYRIVRAAIGGDELAALTAKPSPTYPLLAICAAIESGQPVEIADLIYGTMKGARVTDFEIVRALETRIGKLTVPEKAAIANLDAIFSAVKIAFQIAANVRGKTASIDECRAMAQRVRRYSFNRYT